MKFPGNKDKVNAIVGLADTSENVYRGERGDRTTMGLNDPTARTVMSPKEFRKAYPLTPYVAKRLTWLVRAISARNLQIDRPYMRELRSVKIDLGDKEIGRFALLLHPFSERSPRSGVEQMRLRAVRTGLVSAAVGTIAFAGVTDRLPFISAESGSVAAGAGLASGGPAEALPLLEPGVINNGQAVPTKAVATSFLNKSVTCKEAIPMTLTAASLDASKPANMLALMTTATGEAFSELPAASDGTKFITEVLQNKSLNPGLTADNIAEGAQIFAPTNCTGRGL